MPGFGELLQLAFTAIMVAPARREIKGKVVQSSRVIWRRMAPPVALDRMRGKGASGRRRGQATHPLSCNAQAVFSIQLDRLGIKFAFDGKDALCQ